jgi:hypothetical protein
MKNISFIFLTTSLLTFATCSEQKHTHEHAHDTESSGNAQVDSLKKTVMAVHDAVMPKMDAIMSLRMQTQQQLKQLDSLQKTDSKTFDPQQRQELSTLLTGLDNADEAMMQWMQQFDGQMKNKTDEQKIVYLKNEKVRIDSVQTLMLGCIAKGEKLLQANRPKP